MDLPLLDLTNTFVQAVSHTGWAKKELTGMTLGVLIMTARLIEKSSFLMLFDEDYFPFD